MLNKQSLNQLKQLKKDIDNQKERHQGKVRGTQQRHGFVLIENGKQLLLPHTEMERVFPGDNVQIIKEKDDKGKDIAVIERLIDSSLSDFVGQLVMKGDNSFIIPDYPNLSRWIFVPPTKRNNAKNGDYVECKISRHPFKTQKPQAIVTQIISTNGQSGFEQDYISYKFKLTRQWPESIDQELAAHCEQTIKQQASTRQDLTALNFFTIDPAHSEDLDDALYIEQDSTTGNWTLYIAIADPCAFVIPGGELDKLAQQHAVSVYLAGRTLPMLPPLLSENYASLLPAKQRLALVCKLQIDANGKQLDSSFFEAVIESKAKLSYSQVEQALRSNKPSEANNGSNDQADISDACSEQIRKLFTLRNYLFEIRKLSALVMEEKPDYDIQLDNNLKIKKIVKTDRSDANRMVEEFMLASNQAAADYIVKHGLNAPFISHQGLRAERTNSAVQIVKRFYPDFEIGSLQELRAYIALIQHIKTHPVDVPVQAILSRILSPAKLCSQPAPHMGMGLEHYTRFSSPLRKYSDFLVHRAIKEHLNNSESIISDKQRFDEQAIEQLQDRIQQSKQAVTELDQHLKCEYLKAHTGATFDGIIVKVTSNNIYVKIDAYDMTGVIEKKNLEGKYKFDPLLLQLRSKSITYQLDQNIKVKVIKVDTYRKQVQLKPIKT